MKDPEFVGYFAEEMQGLYGELLPIHESLKKNQNQPKLYEKFGQIIDRVYGTASTMKFDELAEYSRKMKNICYKCSQSTNDKAQRKVFDLVETAIKLFRDTPLHIHDPVEFKKVRYLMHVEVQKIELLERSVFHSIQRGSIT